MKKCEGCLVTEATHACGQCLKPLCKTCTKFVESSLFFLMAKLPEELSRGRYCSNCYEGRIQPALEKYRSIAALAKSVYIVDRPHRRSLPVTRQTNSPIKVEDCKDREESLLRLAFIAAEAGYNAVLKVKVGAKKIRNEGYQKMSWHASGFAAEINSAWFEKRSSDNDD